MIMQTVLKKSYLYLCKTYLKCSQSKIYGAIDPNTTKTNAWWNIGLLTRGGYTISERVIGDMVVS